MDNKIVIPRRLPVLSVKEGVLFPGATLRLTVRSKTNFLMVQDRLSNRLSLRSSIIAVVYKSANEENDNKPFEIGTAAMVTQIFGTNWPSPSYNLTMTGLCRIRVEKFLQNDPYPICQLKQLDKIAGQETEENTDLMSSGDFREKLASFLQDSGFRSASFLQLKKLVQKSPLDLVLDLTAAVLDISYEEKLDILASLEIKQRLEKVRKLLDLHVQKVTLDSEDENNNDEKGQQVVEVLPHVANTDELSKILNNLGGGSFFNRGLPRRFGEPKGRASDDPDDLAQRLKAAKLPPEAEKVAFDEFKKLKSMPSFSPDYSSVRNYLELLAELPWSVETKDFIDVNKAKLDLEQDHYGLADVKKRILEYLAISQLRNTLKGPIICFVGPPGVGKTSIAKSIAKSLGRNFQRIALGGVSDESYVRGHRRTYVASMPGRIIQGLKMAKSKNPVFLLDEIDKMTPGIHGDPLAALLEVLDPEQNVNFVDQYVNVAFDLSKVLFIATANGIKDIPAPLSDRMEIIPIPGYTPDEKFHIASKHLLPKQLQEHGLTAKHVEIPERTLKIIVDNYTREAGVRTLERQIAAVLRAVAVRIAEKSHVASNESSHDAVTPALPEHVIPDLPITVDQHALEEILGPPLFTHDLADKYLVPGVAAGLAWSPLGGSVMYVEATRWDGVGKLTLTGQLGSVMQESATVALNWLRSHAGLVGANLDMLDRSNVHIHFPAGAVNKDGPSAGVTVLVALVSLFTAIPARLDTALTGEITLRGLVLPVGGIKDKVFAAHRAGFSRVVMPKGNMKDVQDLPDSVKEEMKFVFVERLQDVLEAAFEGLFIGEKAKL